MNDKRFLELLHKEEGKLFRIALAILGSESDAWDALQQAVEQAWRSRRSLRGSDAVFPAWIKKITVNCSINLLHRRERVIPVDPLTLPAVMYDPPLSDAAMIWQLVEELGPDLRKVIALRYLGDLSLEEIARALGIPLGTVKSRLHIAHKRLKEMLDDKEQKGVGNIEA
ncbi:MAG: RNA polymerase sigma factor [Syntrophomonadaceae bacterium]|nr:RNA polymerase sigma factor [Syntrophomonadaceae bacterium]